MAVLTIAAIALGAACSTKAKRSQLERTLEKQGARPVEETRIVVRELAAPLAAMIENGADIILEGSADPAARRIALHWKIDGIPSLHQAIYTADPYAAILDTWVLIRQLQDYVTRHDVQSPLEPWKDVVRGTLDRMEHRVVETIKYIGRTDDPIRAREQVNRWAADHPIEDHISTRQSALTDLAEWTASPSGSAFRAVGGITEGMGDLAHRLDVYYEYLPKIGRWQAQLAMEEILTPAELEEMLSALTSVEVSIPRVAEGIEALPDLVDTQRDTILDIYTLERDAVLAIVREYIDESFSFVTSERKAALDDVRAELEATILRLEAHRDPLLQDAESIGTRLVDDAIADAMVEARDLVDYVLVRVAILGGIGLLAAFVGALVIVRMKR